MELRGDVSPSTLPIEITTSTIRIDYLDGRRVRYPGPHERVTETVRCAPGKEVHILVTNDAETEGIIVYINDRRTSDDILLQTGVGRLILGTDEETELFPGVTVRMDGYSVVVSANPGVADGRVFVFEEDEFAEQSYEVVGE